MKVELNAKKNEIICAMSPSEFVMIRDLLKTVRNSMELDDEDTGIYSDNDNFILSMYDEQYQCLCSICDTMDV